MAKNKFYAYIIENENRSGILSSWPECQKTVKGKKARYKGFPSEAEAKAWLNSGANYKEKFKFYAYYLTETGFSGITNTWKECQEITKGGKARYKSFSTEKEAKAWLAGGAIYQTKAMLQEKLKEGIYFDAGTGRGIGVETRLTDKFGTSILHRVLEKEKINEFGNLHLEKGSTNNFGELVGIYLALKISLKEGHKDIFGDSKLVIEYWSKGFFKKENLNDKSISLIEKVVKLRKEFESKGGKVSHVSGDINPADLGFHK